MSNNGEVESGYPGTHLVNETSITITNVFQIMEDDWNMEFGTYIHCPNWATWEIATEAYQAAEERKEVLRDKQPIQIQKDTLQSDNMTSSSYKDEYSMSIPKNFEEAWHHPDLFQP